MHDVLEGMMKAKSITNAGEVSPLHWLDYNLTFFSNTYTVLTRTLPKVTKHSCADTARKYIDMRTPGKTVDS